MAAPEGREISLIANGDPRGPIANPPAVSSDTARADYNLDGAVCMRELVTQHTPDAMRVQAGMQRQLASGRLHGLPVIIVQGQPTKL